MRLKPPSYQLSACLHRMRDAFVKNLKERSNITLRLWADHCEYILAQRFRRGQQIFTFYHRIWGEHALIQLLYGFRRQIQRNLKGILLSSVGLYAFDWEKERISYDTVKPHFDDVDFVKKLQKETLICSNCEKRIAIGEKVEGTPYCVCKGISQDSVKRSSSGWEPYLEGKNMLIWRREEKPSRYSYKVYCVYDDITASDFIQVQTDLEYRKIWDDTAIVLNVVDTDPIDTSRSQIVYWEMRWPALFANRDYVYSRRYFINNVKNVVVLCSRSTKHPKCPVKSDKHRVVDYWSFMTVKPFTTINEPGLEFVLTYYDDPGVSLPAYITNWVAQKQMPDFLNKLYNATKEFYYRKKYNKKMTYSWEQLKTSEDAKYRRPTEVNTADSEGERGALTSSLPVTDDNANNAENESTRRSWWSYLYPNHLFA